MTNQRPLVREIDSDNDFVNSEKTINPVNNQDPSFPFDIQNDRIRFQLIIVRNQKGYYDLVEKKFIPIQKFRELIDEITPNNSLEIRPDNSIYTDNVKKRINQNLSYMHQNKKDSYSVKLLKYISNRFLSSQPNRDIFSAILFVDIVKSTNLANTLEPDKMSSLIRVFSQEMSLLISKHSGFVLKYAGDAAIAFFPILTNVEDMCQNAIRCAKAMNNLVRIVINPSFVKFRLPEIKIRVGVEAGNNQIVFFGGDPDLIGTTITMTSKICPVTKPSHTAIGEEIFKKLRESQQIQFLQEYSDSTKLPYANSNTGKDYVVYLSSNAVS